MTSGFSLFSFIKKLVSIIRVGRVYSNPDKAISVSVGNLNNDTTSKTDLWNLSKQHYSKGNVKEAREFATKLLKLDPRDIDGLKILTELCFNSNNYDEAYIYAKRYLEEKIVLDGQMETLSADIGEGRVADWLKSRTISVLNNSEDAKWTEWATNFASWYEETTHGAAEDKKH